MQDLRPVVCDLGLSLTDRTPRILIGTEAQKMSPKSKRSDIAGSVALPVPLLPVLVRTPRTSNTQFCAEENCGKVGALLELQHASFSSSFGETFLTPPLCGA